MMVDCIVVVVECVDEGVCDVKMGVDFMMCVMYDVDGVCDVIDDDGDEGVCEGVMVM